MKWKKLGYIFCADRNYPWMHAYASYPWAEHIENNVFKIFFSCRNSSNESSIGFITIDILKFSHVLEISPVPVLSPGETGTFDDSGVSMSCISSVAENKFLYYLGWNKMVTVPWKNTIGLAVYNKDLQIFERYSKAPVVGIDHVDPFTLTYPYVMFDNGMFKMWYGSSLFWGGKVEETIHVIKYAYSHDGINWHRDGNICIEPEHQDEFAIVKPFVLKENNIFKMWYSFRQNISYQVGYAESADGINWIRKDDEAGIKPSSTGWDSEMVCYPFIFDHLGIRYMLYNGNGYGKTGFGIAVLEKQKPATELILQKDKKDIWFGSEAHTETYPESGYNRGFAIEDQSFWFQHRNEVILQIIKNFPFDGNFADIGGGNGYQAYHIEKNLNSKQIYLVEPGYQGCLNARKRGLTNVYNLMFREFPFIEKNINAVGMFDVIEHIEDDKDFLIQLSRLVSPGTIIYITVPAYQWLWSDVDDFGHHFRRYNQHTLLQLALQCDLKILYHSYFFQYLVPLTYTLRHIPYKLGIRRTSDKIVNADNNQHASKSFINKVFDRFNKRELKIFRQRGKFTFGASCIAVFQTK